MFNGLKVYFLFFCTVISTSSGVAGAVSGGGGGTTNPYPARMEDIEKTVQQYGGPVLLMLLNKQEERFENLADKDKLKSPFYKLFRPTSGEDIFVVAKRTRIEIRRSAPCYDAQGLPWEGSVYASQSGAICISAFLMAPKLTENNYAAETIGLVAHELSHLMGATEDEAVQIQRNLVWPINETSMADALIKLQIAVNPSSPEMTKVLDTWISAPERVTPGDLSSWNNRLYEDLYNFTGLSNGELSMLRYETLNSLMAQMSHIDILKDFSCSRDPQQHPRMRQDCADRLLQGFRGEQTVSVRTYLLRNSGQQVLSGSNDALDKIFVQKLTTPQDLAKELTQLQNYFISFSKDLEELNRFRSSVDVTP